jgi:hypothetical protein
MFEPTKTELPELKPDGTQPFIEFEHHTRKFKAPVVIYADFETLKKPLTVEHDESKSSTTRLAEMPPCSGAFRVVSDYPELNMGYHQYVGEDAVEKFLKGLVKIGDQIRYILNNEKPMKISAEEQKAFNRCNTCHICDKYIESNELKVRDHDHITGMYRGCAHQSCNVNFNYRNFQIPVYFHNLKGFDGHLIIQGLRKMNFQNIRLIAQNFEKYMSISFGEFRFLDSFAFMSSSLDKLSGNLLKDGKHNFKYTLGDGLNKTQEELILRKGVYPYDYIDSLDRFNETKLPSIEKFYSELNEGGISVKDYQHAKDVWEAFQMNTLREYHDLYLRTDINLLADVFEAFRKTAIENYGLDPANGYFTLPNYAWDAMLKKTGVKLEQLTDINMYQMCEQGVRGGTSLISHRYAHANNKYMKDYDSEKDTTYIMYLDANNLYGHSMGQNLPVGNFEWVHLDENQISNYCDGDIGYFVKCDLHYP